MKYNWLFCTLFFFAVNSFAQAPTVYIISPSSNQKVLDSSLSVTAEAYAQYDTCQVVATIAGRSAVLIYNPDKRQYEGKVSITGLPENTDLTLQVIATDVLQNTGSAQVTISYFFCPPPTVILESPVAGEIIGSSIHIKAKATSRVGFTLSFKLGNWMICTGAFHMPATGGPLTYNLSDTISIDTVINLKNFSVNYTYGPISSIYEMESIFQLWAVDTFNRYGADGFHVYYYTDTANFKKVLTLDGIIHDVNFGKVLSSNDGKATITDIASGDTTILPYYLKAGFLGNAGCERFWPRRYRGKLTDNGMLFWDGPVMASDYPDASVLGYEKFFQWINTPSSQPFIETSLDRAYIPNNFFEEISNTKFIKWGWVGSGSLQLKNLQTQTTHILTSETVGLPISNVSENGSFIYIGDDKEIYQYDFENDKSVKISAYFANKEIFPLYNSGRFAYNGINMLYNKVDSFSIGSTPNYTLYLFNGYKEFKLVKYPDGFYNVPTAINDKWVLYPKNDSQGISQVWMVDSSGNTQQKTFFNTGSEPEMVDSKGNFTFFFKGKRHYYDNQTGKIYSIGINDGLVFLDDTAWYIALYKTLYKLDIDQAIANHSSNSVIHVYKDSSYHFTIPDFVNNFTGADTLRKIRIAKLPFAGIVNLDGIPVYVNQEINVADLNKLVYENFGGPFSLDYISWKGATADFYSSDTGVIKIIIDTVPVSNAGEITGFDISIAEKNAILSWNTHLEQQASKFQIERSFDGVNFTVIGEINAGTTTTYSFTDVNIGTAHPNEHIYYRVKLLFTNGQYVYSSVRLVIFNVNLNHITNSVIHVIRDSSHNFATADFSNNFVGTASLETISISQLPVAGILSLAGNPVSLNQEIWVNNLDKIEYKNQGGIINIDSILWKGATGNLYSLNAGVIKIIIDTIPVPVQNNQGQVNDLYATISGKNALLSWHTQIENNINKFEVERSFDGISFAKIGEVNPAGSSDQPVFYTYSDVNIDIAHSNEYITYRIKLLFTDGAYAYSNFSSVIFNVKNEVHIFPNPSSNNITIDISDVNPYNIPDPTYTIINQNGQVVLSGYLNPSTTIIDISTLQTGVYVVNVSVTSGSVRFVKL